MFVGVALPKIMIESINERPDNTWDARGLDAICTAVGGFAHLGSNEPSLRRSRIRTRGRRSLCVQT